MTGRQIRSSPANPSFSLACFLPGIAPVFEVLVLRRGDAPVDGRRASEAGVHAIGEGESSRVVVRRVDHGRVHPPLLANCMGGRRATLPARIDRQRESHGSGGERADAEEDKRQADEVLKRRT